MMKYKKSRPTCQREYHGNMEYFSTAFSIDIYPHMAHYFVKPKEMADRFGRWILYSQLNNAYGYELAIYPAGAKHRISG
jgi:hypothetical protein